MTKRAKSAQNREAEAPAPALPPSLLQLPNVRRCGKISELAYQFFRKAGDSDRIALEKAKRLYRCAMPAPIDLESIRDFIACVTFGAVAGVFSFKHANSLYYGAQVALNASRSTAPTKKA